jgi:hypothetical protein
MAPKYAKRVAAALKRAWPFYQAKIDDFRADNPKVPNKDVVNAIVNEERLREIRKATGWQGGAGRPASGADPNSPAALAARDIWRIRHVILPRFWPQGAKPGWGLTNAKLATIAAARHPGATATAALSCYENERRGSL